MNVSGKENIIINVKENQNYYKENQDYYNVQEPTAPEKKYKYKGKDGLEYETIEELKAANQIYLESLFPKVDKDDSIYCIESEVSRRRR